MTLTDEEKKAYQKEWGSRPEVKAKRKERQTTPEYRAKRKERTSLQPLLSTLEFMLQ